MGYNYMRTPVSCHSATDARSFWWTHGHGEIMRWKRAFGRGFGAIIALIVILVLLRIPLWPFPLPDGRFKSAVAVTIYDTHGVDYSQEALSRVTSVSMDPRRFRSLVADAEHKMREPIFKGASLVIVTLPDGTRQRLKVSYHGGFFKVLGEPGHWKSDELYGVLLGLQWALLPHVMAQIPPKWVVTAALDPGPIWI